MGFINRNRSKISRRRLIIHRQHDDNTEGTRKIHEKGEKTGRIIIKILTVLGNSSENRGEHRGN